MTDDSTIRTGVIGVGSMGRHHARVYRELPGAALVGVADADEARATEIAVEYGTGAYDIETLLDRVDAVTIAVPTAYHYELANRCIDAGVDVLIEKPIVERPARGRELVSNAEAAGVTLQVGHIERFNPATRTLSEIVPDLNVIAIDTERLGPPPERSIEDTAVMDLMIHDIDVVRSVLPGAIESVDAIGNHDGRHATATIEFDDGVLGTLTASRVTQRKVRRLTVTAAECYVTVDFIDQSVQIHRQSVPEYVTENGDVRYRHESVVENPAVENGEPLKAELRSFLAAAAGDREPMVTGEDGVRALTLAREINERAFGSPDHHVGAPVVSR